MRSRSPAKPVIPERLLKLVGDPPLMQFEDEKAYNTLLSEFAVAYEPRDIVDWIYVQDAVNLTWEIQRLRSYRTRIIDIERRYGLADIFGIIVDKGDLTPEERSAAGAKMAAAFCDGDFKEELAVYTLKGSLMGERKPLIHFVGKRHALLQEWKRWGFDEEAISAATFERKMACMEALDRLIASSEARRNRTIRELENRRTNARARVASPRMIEHERTADAPRRARRRRSTRD